MMPSVKIFLWLVIVLQGVFVDSQFTRITKRENVFLSRRKRYLNFPKGSNFVMTLSFTKPIMQVQPTGWTSILECDVPFALPEDARKTYKMSKIHYRQRREILDQLASALAGIGFNSSACVQRLVCEAQEFLVGGKKRSCVRDILGAIFQSRDDDDEHFSICENHIFQDCPVSLLEYIVGSLTNSQ